MPSSDRSTKAEKDVCGCCVGCYPNGLVSLLLAQVLLLLGFLLSGTSMVDCRFVKADVYIEGDVGPPDLNSSWISSDDPRTGFGFISYEDVTGECKFKTWAEADENQNVTTDEQVEDYVNDYIEWLGDDWDRGRQLLGSALGAAFIMFGWVIVMMCAAHIRPIRILAALIPLILLVPLQFATLSVLTSDFCLDRQCNLNRSGFAAIFAGLFYFLAGLTLCFTHNYVRQIPAEQSPMAASSSPSSSSRNNNNSNNNARNNTSNLPASPGEVEMEVIEDASFVIESTTGQRTHVVEEVVIGDGLAEAQEIKPDMVFLHDDGEIHRGPGHHVPSSPYIPEQEVVPTVTDVQIIDEEVVTSKKVAP